MSSTSTRDHALMSEEAHRHLTKRYAPVLNRAKNFLAKKGTSKTGGSASEIRKKTLLDVQADCPQCGLRFVGKNHNTEHIHPKSLGGDKGNSANRIQMCRMCNNARASTMTSVIGTAPYHKNYPSNWPKIEAFLVWSEYTIDEGLEAGAQIPEVHELFIEARFAGAKPLGARPHRAYDRFSTWSPGDEPNYPHNSSRLVSLQTEVQPTLSASLQVEGGFEAEQAAATPTLRSILARKARDMFDRIFDYEPKKADNATSQVADVNESETTIRSLEPEVDKHALFEKWKSFVELQIWCNTGEMMLGDFWDLVTEEKTAHGTGWRAFERGLGLTHKAAMPAKASELLQQMGYVFSFQKSEAGYRILFNSEEE